MTINILAIVIAMVCVMLTLVILVQNPKGGGVDSTFGGQSANQMFGAAKSADFIEKLTWGLAFTLFALCIVTVLVVNSGSAEAINLIEQ